MTEGAKINQFPVQMKAYIEDFASDVQTKKPEAADLILPEDQQWQCTVYDYNSKQMQFHLRFTPGSTTHMPLFMSTDITAGSPAFTVLNKAKKLVPAYADVLTGAARQVWFSQKLAEDANSPMMLMRGLQTATAAAEGEAGEEATRRQIFLEFLQPFDSAFPAYEGEVSPHYTDSVDGAERSWVIRSAGSCTTVKIPE